MNLTKLISALLLSTCAATVSAQQTQTPAASGSAPANAPLPTPQLTATGPGERNAPPARGPTLAAALELAKKIDAVCAADGFHVGIAVIDVLALPKLYYTADGAGGQHANQAFRKANTALKFNMNSSKVGQARRDNPQLAALWDASPGSFAGGGGVLLKVGDEVIGAVGVSGGAPSSKDEECALAALKEVQPLLK